MTEYIKREAVMKTATDGYHSDFGKSMADLTSLREVLEDTPTADVVPWEAAEKIFKAVVKGALEADELTMKDSVKVLKNIEKNIGVRIFTEIDKNLMELKDDDTGHEYIVLDYLEYVNIKKKYTEDN